MIIDSGIRKQFQTGAVRDITEGKGRMDLLPLDVIGIFMETEVSRTEGVKFFFNEVAAFQKDDDPQHLIVAARWFAERHFDHPATAVLEYSRHMEEGCQKYGPRNWQKGIPLDRYVDSAMRHYMKVRRGDDDERHDRAVLWNLLCGAWTAIHIPEMTMPE